MTLFCSVDPAVPATTQRPPLKRARATVSGSGCPAIFAVVVLHTGVFAALQTFRLNVSVFVVFGYVNVTLAPSLARSGWPRSFAAA